MEGGIVRVQPKNYTLIVLLNSLLPEGAKYSIAWFNVVTCCAKVIADCPLLLSTDNEPMHPENVPRLYLIRIVSALDSLKTIALSD